MDRPFLGCGAFVLSDRGLLLGQRLNDPEKDRWGLPGGKVDFGEGTEAATVRELREETGMEISLRGLLCVSDQLHIAGDHWVSVIYLAEAGGQTPTVREPHKIGGLAFFPLGNLPSPLTRATIDALAAYKRRA